MSKFIIPRGVLRSKLNNVLTSRSSFIQDRINFGSLLASISLNIIHWIFLYIKIKPDSSTILLHYNVVSGADLIGNSAYLYLIPFAALVLLAVNAVIAGVFYDKEKLVSYFLNVASVAVQIIFFIATIALVIANAQ